MVSPWPLPKSLPVFVLCDRNESIATFNELIDKNVSPNDADVLHVMCCADEFENIRVRHEELDEIDRIKKESCPIKTIAPVEDYSGKVRKNQWRFRILGQPRMIT